MKNINNLKDIGFYTLSNDRAENISPTSQMKRGEIILLEYCNFSCPYCRGLKDEIYGDRKIKQLSFDEVKNIIDIWCKNSPMENIRFSGGEPTLHKNIIDIVKYSKSKGIKRIAISTNGSNKIELYKELIECGANDFSISLDACCASDGDKMAGNKKGSWEKVVENIKEISKLTYVTLGVVFTPDNVSSCLETIRFSHSLGVADIRIIPSAQWNEPLVGLENLEQEILDVHPILKYRVTRFINNGNVRGMIETDSNRCAIVLDDSAIAGDFSYPCVIYMREQGDPIGKVGQDMRSERFEWFKNHDCLADPICKKNCIDACREFNLKVKELNKNIGKYM